VLSQLEERDVTAALRLSLQSSWDSDDEQSDAGSDAAAASTSSDEEAEQKADAAEREEGEWTHMLHDVAVPLPRLRHLQNRPPPANITPLQLLQRFLPPALMEEFAEYTNAAVPHDWRHTTAAELYAFLGVHLYMGIDRLPRTHMYWSDTFGHPRIAALFSRNRFVQLLSYFAVTPPDDAAAVRDPLPHVRALAEKLNVSFAAQYTPTQLLALDEAMVAFKGRSPIKQYIPSKPHKWGYKVWCLASDDYLLHFEIYEGAEDAPSDAGATVDTALRMTAHYQQQQYVLFTDNWFTSPALMSALEERGIRLCGSVRRNRRGMPAIPADDINALERGEWIQRQKGDATVAVWRDQKPLWVLYNHCSPNETSSLQRWNERGERVAIGCPRAIRDYFYHARSVDVLSQLHYSYPIGRKARRCWPRLAWWLLDMCVVNAFKLWSIGQHRPCHLRFREELMLQLMEQLPADQRPKQQKGHFCASNCLASQHFSVLVAQERDCVDAVTALPDANKPITLVQSVACIYASASALLCITLFDDC